VRKGHRLKQGQTLHPAGMGRRIAGQQGRPAGMTHPVKILEPQGGNHRRQVAGHSLPVVVRQGRLVAVALAAQVEGVDVVGVFQMPDQLPVDPTQKPVGVYQQDSRPAAAPVGDVEFDAIHLNESAVGLHGVLV